MKFKFLEHTADIKFQAFGKSLEEVFKNSASAMVASMNSGKIQKKITKKIKVKGNDLENLLYNFLEEFLVLLESENFFLAEIKNLKINQKNMKLEAEVIGDYAKNYEIGVHIKAITYNEMFIKEKKGKWISQVVVDV